MLRIIIAGALALMLSGCATNCHPIFGTFCDKARDDAMKRDTARAAASGRSAARPAPRDAGAARKAGPSPRANAPIAVPPPPAAAAPAPAAKPPAKPCIPRKHWWQRSRPKVCPPG
jgi:hypothetical protein